ncbi:unnamed protein product [Adineta steineri]|uniref:Uncharacterized protein n=1 Tax=Adineta steineri TaxID=433720 RepID=A0A819H5S9_9BILA|nr:unnamed protein product [Adineta steineri]CAF3898211.1 unnamed protein product [Adineta steineri]
MTTATSLCTTDDSESCVFCKTKHNRTRPSFCLCKHCSIPLCFDCIKQHHDDILQNLTLLSHQYNQSKQLIQIKQNMILDQTAKAIEYVNDHFDTYIIELRQTQKNIIEDLQTSKQQAQEYVLKINSDLQTISLDIQALTKESIAQTCKMINLSAQIEKIDQQLNTYEVIRTDNLFKTKPTFSIAFDCISIPKEASDTSVIEINIDCETESKDEPTAINTLDIPQQSLSIQELSINHVQENDDITDVDDDSSVFDDDDDDSTDRDLKNGIMITSCTVNRMASDGQNILYTSYNEEESDIIAYSLVNNKDGSEDMYIEWKQSRIDDMIWCNSIQRFICATKNGIYTVEYINGRYNIFRVVRGNYSYIRVGANTTNIFLHYTIAGEETDEIATYGLNFDMVNVFDVRSQKYFCSSSSFCVTDNSLASICTRIQHNRRVFKMNLFDLNMKELKWMRLGECDDMIEIRSDENELFFIATGRRKLHIISFHRKMQTIELEDDGDCIAILNNRRIAITKGRRDIELISY